MNVICCESSMVEFVSLADGSYYFCPICKEQKMLTNVLQKYELSDIEQKIGDFEIVRLFDSTNEEYDHYESEEADECETICILKSNGNTVDADDLWIKNSKIDNLNNAIKIMTCWDDYCNPEIMENGNDAIGISIINNGLEKGDIVSLFTAKNFIMKEIK